MPLHWINPADYSANHFLLLERFQIRMICGYAARRESVKTALCVLLRYHPCVAWVFARRCPECAEAVEQFTAEAPEALSPDQVRAFELSLIESVEDFITYTTPEVMDTQCDFIRDWDPQRLFEMADLNGKVVLDVGSGSGRLAFVAAERAKMVYASEPVGTLREYLRDKIKRERIPNVRVVDGMVHALPYPDDTFDVVMSGHVVGDDYESELTELTRVVKSGGWIVDCCGDGDCIRKPDEELRKRGWEEFFHVSKTGGQFYRYRKQIYK